MEKIRELVRDFLDGLHNVDYCQDSADVVDYAGDIIFIN